MCIYLLAEVKVNGIGQQYQVGETGYTSFQTGLGQELWSNKREFTGYFTKIGSLTAGLIFMN